MHKVIIAALLAMLLVCACETTPPQKTSQEETRNAPVEVTVGGEVRVQGQYRDFE